MNNTLRNTDLYASDLCVCVCVCVCVGGGGGVSEEFPGLGNRRGRAVNGIPACRTTTVPSSIISIGLVAKV